MRQYQYTNWLRDKVSLLAILIVFFSKMLFAAVDWGGGGAIFKGNDGQELD